MKERVEIMKVNIGRVVDQSDGMGMKVGWVSCCVIVDSS